MSATSEVQSVRPATPLARIFWTTFFVLWALTAVYAVAIGGGLIDAMFSAINGAFWGGLVVLVVWLVRKWNHR